MLKGQKHTRGIHAVLTCDIVSSTRIRPEIEERLRGTLMVFLQKYEFAFYRGDSFQIYVEDPALGLQMALVCRTAAIAISAGDEGPDAVLADLRVSIGIGTVIAPVTSVGEAKGEAFLRSGRSLDAIEDTARRLSIVSDHPMADIGFRVMADYLDSIYGKMTGKQASVILHLLQDVSQQEIAQRLEKSKSTISQLADSGRWEEIYRLLGQYEDLIKLLL